MFLIDIITLASAGIMGSAIVGGIIIGTIMFKKIFK